MNGMKRNSELKHKDKKLKRSKTGGNSNITSQFGLDQDQFQRRRKSVFLVEQASEKSEEEGGVIDSDVEVLPVDEQDTPEERRS